MKKIFSGLIVAVFTVMMIAGVSYAGTLADAANTKVAQEVVDSATPTVINADDLVYIMGIARTTAQDFIIKYTLSSGTFDATPPVPALAGTGVAITTLRSGGIDQDFVEYEVDVTTGIIVTDTFTLNADINPPLAMETVGTKITCTVLLYDLYSDLDTSGDHTGDVLESAYGSTATAPAAPTALTVDVASGKTKFLVATVQVTDVALGTITVDTSVAGVNSEDVDTPTAFALAAGDLVSIVLTGDFSACKTAVLGGVYIDAVAPFGSFNVGDIVPATLTDTIATFTPIAGNAFVTSDIRMQVDGITSIPVTPTTISASLNMAAATDNDRDYFTGTTIATYSYNGTVVYPGIIIGSGYGYSGGFRIVNRASTDANIYFQVQNNNGAMLTEVAYSGNPLAAGATVYIPTDTVLTEGGLTTTSSANGIITVESASADVYQISYISTGGFTIVPLTATNNQ